MPFMADCAALNQRIEDGRGRAVRVLKISRFAARARSPICHRPGKGSASNGVHPEPQPFSERVSTGINAGRVLGGGFYRGTNALITGSSAPANRCSQELHQRPAAQRTRPFHLLR